MDSTLDGPIELALPADTRLLRLVRLVASGLASTAGFDVDELDVSGGNVTVRITKRRGDK